MSDHTLQRASAGAVLAACALIAWCGAQTLVTHAPARVLHRVDVNTASPAELELLPRIGPALSAAIDASREAEGAFAGVESLQRVSRVGPKTVEGLRPWAVAGGPGAGGRP